MWHFFFLSPCENNNSATSPWWSVVMRCFVSGYWNSKCVIYYPLKCCSSATQNEENQRDRVSQHDINLMRPSQGLNKRRYHTNRPGGLHLLCWRQADVHASHFYLYCVIEVTKAIFFPVHKAGDLSSSGCFAFFHVMTEWRVLYTCDATWTLLQNRNHRRSMFCRYLNCHISSVTLKPMFWSVGTSISVFSVLQSYSIFSTCMITVTTDTVCERKVS